MIEGKEDYSLYSFNTAEELPLYVKCAKWW